MDNLSRVIEDMRKEIEKCRQEHHEFLHNEVLKNRLLVYVDRLQNIYERYHSCMCEMRKRKAIERVKRIMDTHDIAGNEQRDKEILMEIIREE